MDPITPETRIAHQQHILHAMTDVGADLVQMVHAQARAQAAANPAASLSASVRDYERAARTVRRNILLSEKLDHPARHRSAARRQIIRAVEDNIHRHADDDEELHAELLDRLDRSELAEELDDDRPVEAIITDIVRDLGLAAIPGLNDPWKRRTPDEIATLHARASDQPPNPGLSRPRLDRGRGAEWAKVPTGPLGTVGMPTEGTPPPDVKPPAAPSG